MVHCTNEDLVRFGREHYTFINQFFGDKGVRMYIKHIFKKQNKKYKLVFDKNASSRFASDRSGNSGHHYVINRQTKQEMCSDELGYQTQINDTLCQTYSLMHFFDLPVNNENRKEMQEDMVRMYRSLLENKEFMNYLENGDPKKKQYGLIFPNPDWKDYRNNDKGEPFVNMTKDELFENVKRVLNDWESFGYYYFIGDGECPETEVSPVSPVSPATENVPVSENRKRSIMTDDVMNKRVTRSSVSNGGRVSKKRYTKNKSPKNNRK